MRAITMVVALGLVCGCDSSPVRPTPLTGSVAGRADTTSPTITAISPNRAIAGAAALTVTVTGTNFVSGFPAISWVRWSANGVTTDLWQTEVISSTELRVAIPAARLKSAGKATVLVENGDPMGASDGYDGYPKSNSVEFEIVVADGMPPTITAISPTHVGAGEPAFTLTVTGTNFVSGFPIKSWVRWSANGVTTDLWDTQVVSSTELRVLIPASLLLRPCTASVLVENGDPMGVSDGYDGYPKSNSIGLLIFDPLSARR